MNAIFNIKKYRTIILIVGLIAALGIVAQPVLKNYVNCTEVCDLKKDSQSESDETQEDQESERGSKDQVSALEAVAPTAQVEVAPLDLTLVNLIAAVRPKAIQALEATVKLPKKLIKVLFTVLIARNAP